MEPDVTELEPGRLQVVLPDGGTRIVLVPAGVGVPGASDEDLAATVVQVLLDAGHEVPSTLDVPDVLRTHPETWTEVERRLDG